jgi:transcription antitermination factor NusG
MARLWYTLHSHPHKEDLLWQQVLAHGIEAFYPRIKVAVVNPRSRKIRPYFPGYMFVNTDINEVGLSIFQWMPYATGLVSFGGEPAAVPENLIQAIQQRVGEIADAGGEIFDSLKSGDRVTIDSGPFAGYEAIFDMRIAGTERVRILLKMLNDRNVPVELRAGQIRKKKSG